MIWGDWLSMDSAPRDGTDILLFCRNDYRPKGGELVRFIEVGAWGNLWDEFQWETDDGTPLSPQAWMPLPPMPPEEE